MYESAKKTMNGDGKAKYDSAKEKASQAAGDLGARMRGKSAELRLSYIFYLLINSVKLSVSHDFPVLETNILFEIPSN